MLHFFRSRVKQVLLHAYDQLPQELILDPAVSCVTVQDFHEFLEHNEWGLALETLEEIAEQAPHTPAFWLLLAQAARLMQNEAEAKRYETYGQKQTGESGIGSY